MLIVKWAGQKMLDWSWAGAVLSCVDLQRRPILLWCPAPLDHLPNGHSLTGTLARYEPNSAARSQSVLNLGDGISCANQIINGGLRSIRTYLNAIANVACRFARISERPGHFHFDILHVNVALRRFTVNIVAEACSNCSE
jgi:hypothetical protein